MIKVFILAIIAAFAAGMIIQDKLFIAEDSTQCREVCIGHSVKHFNSCYCMAEME
jgi:hypothetical protein